MSKASFAIAALVLAASPASAHISLEPKQATIGSSYKAVFAVPHGCAGYQPPSNEMLWSSGRKPWRPK